MRTGLEILLEDRPELLQGKRVALLINATSVTRDLEISVAAFLGVRGCHVRAIWAPEHGVHGVAQDMESVAGEPDLLGVPIRSLYGSSAASLAPPAEWLDEIDAIVYDVQDVGSRYYTFLATLSHAMESAASRGVEVIVCDRPNPIGGVEVEGGTVRSTFTSFVGRYPMSTRHGLTSAEAARFMNDAGAIGARLTAVPMQGYRRDLWYDQTGLPWVMPSPNMPTLDTATVYPGACLFEGTNLSEGRGTTRPFELAGAPWIDGPRLARHLNGRNLPGVRFRSVAFRPKHQKWRDQTCEGVQIHVTNRQRFKPLLAGVAILCSAAELFTKHFAWREDAYEFVTDRLAIDLLAGNDVLRGQIERGDPLDVIEASWERDRQDYLAKREAILLY
ncbi:MAG: DUF1343 domain-containing protein [Acidobacteriota bacterium]